MYSTTVSVKNLPVWAENYFKKYREWFAEVAPKPLPSEYSSYLPLFAESIGVEYDISTNLNTQKNEIESFTFTWKSLNDQSMFLLKF